MQRKYDKKEGGRIDCTAERGGHMKAIVVDDEPIMLRSFARLSGGIADLEIIGQFQRPEEALAFVKSHRVELAFLDVKMPKMNGIELAEKMREVRKDILIVFISAYDEFIRESNRIGGDYYIVKPYKTETLELMMERIRILSRRQKKDIFIRTFGRFNVFYLEQPVVIRGKAKEILALAVTRRGREISNEEIYRTIWENRTYSNANMTVYYNALRRLKQALAREGLGELLISTAHGQMVNTSLFDCDYYDWLDGTQTKENEFEGEFLSEYSWGEYILGSMVNKYE